MPTPPGYADIAIAFSQNTVIRPAYITFGADPTDTTVETVGANVINAINAAGSLKTVIDSSVTISEIVVSLGTDGTADITGSVPTAIIGGASGSYVPPNCAVLVRKNTARGGRRGRGRFFIPWAVTTINCGETGIIASAYVTTLQNAMNAFLTALTTFTVPMYLLHSPGQTAEGPPNLVTSLTVDPLVGTQRRRLGR